MKKAQKTKEWVALAQIFEEATRLSFTFVVYPVLFLLIGVLADKQFGTKPLFILVGVVVGIVAGLFMGIKSSKRFLKHTKNE
jgi:F0F1-type ATP synthase assembly protein I